MKRFLVFMISMIFLLQTAGAFAAGGLCLHTRTDVVSATVATAADVPPCHQQKSAGKGAEHASHKADSASGDVCCGAGCQCLHFNPVPHLGATASAELKLGLHNPGFRRADTQLASISPHILSPPPKA